MTLDEALRQAHLLRRLDKYGHADLERRWREQADAARQIAEAAGATLEVLRGRQRDSWTGAVRFIVASHLREAGASLPEIARLLNRDHTTVGYMLRRRPKLLDQEGQLLLLEVVATGRRPGAVA